MRLVLPKNKEQLSKAIDAMVAPAIDERNIQQVGWYVTDLYLQGVRNFSLLDYETGTVEYFYDDGDGADYDWDLYNGVPFRWEDAISRIQTELGRLSRLDTEPKVGKKPFTLESLRNAAVGQVLLDEMLRGYDTRSVDVAFRLFCVLYGTAGLAHWQDTKSGVTNYECEAIPPWELLGLPARSAVPGAHRTTVRDRLVPYSQLERRPEFKLKGVPEDEFEFREMPYGAGPTLSYMGTNGATVGSGSYAELFRDAGKYIGDKRSKAVHGERFVNLQEVFVPGPKNTLCRYIAKAGKAIIADQEYPETEYKPFPIGVGRYLDIGHFYGRSFAGKVIPYTMRMEHLMKQMLLNAEDMDRYGYLFIPNDAGITDDNLRGTRGRKHVFYNWDPTSARDPIQQVEPTTTSDFPGKVIQFMVEQADRLTSQSPLLMGMTSGREDSGTALQTLAETGSTHLLTTAESIEEAYGTMYRSLLFQAKEALRAGSLQKAQLTRVDSAMAGLRINPADGSVDLTGVNIPDIWTLDIGIRSNDPSRHERRRNEGLIFLREQRMTPLAFAILNYKEGWDYPIGKESFWEAYVKATLDNLVLFNDGEQPGAIKGNEYFDIPSVQMFALEEFVATPAFAQASDEVKNAFASRMQFYKAKLGMALPNGMSNPDDAAMLAQITTQQQMMAQKQGMRAQARPAPGA